MPMEMPEPHPTLDATLITKLDASGSWTDTTNLSGEMTLDFSCTGTDCATALQQSPYPFSIPCSTTFDYTASRN